MESSIASLFDEYFTSVYKYVFFRVRNQQDAEDIVADVFEKILKKQHTFQQQHGATIRSWIFAIARNTLIDYYRKQHHQPDSLDVAESSAEIAHHDRVENTVDTAMDLQRVYAVLDQLPPRQQEIVLLRLLLQQIFSAWITGKMIWV
ncbi:MAG: RNA polymerase sigma factor [Candidatus Kerfeldbacteria bacterium]|nr:RNA polymerase sigma factor [Candidatus Kerfeldbacteria bacterium]